jgi:hypothetical protein
MMKQEMAREIIRSRSQTESTMAREGIGLLSGTALGSVASVCPRMIGSILYGLDSSRVWIDSAVHRTTPRLLRPPDSGYNTTES